jgi:hypothetical protein
MFTNVVTPARFGSIVSRGGKWPVMSAETSKSDAPGMQAAMLRKLSLTTADIAIAGDHDRALAAAMRGIVKV